MADNELFGNSEQLDTISRAAAIDALNNVLADYIPCLIGRNEEIPLKCAVAIRYLPSAQQWIPWDSGKLPGESGYYTVTAYDGTTKRVTHAKYQKRLKRWELTGAMAYWRVLAWLPPIEPWEGEEHGTSRTMLPKKSLR